MWLMNSVNGPLVLVNSNSGKIHYDGEFGGGGEYTLTSHTGDIEAMAPSYASIDVTARSEQGKVENDFQLASQAHLVPLESRECLRGHHGQGGIFG